MVVDEAVGRIHDELVLANPAPKTRSTGFLSDNGILYGEHRVARHKKLPYRMATNVPLLLRWDGHAPPGTTDRRLALNVVLAETITRAAGLGMPTEGLPLLGSSRRRGFPLEGQAWRHASRLRVPSFCGYRTRRYTFVRYRSGFEELYDYRRDLHELANRARWPGLRDAGGLAQAPGTLYVQTSAAEVRLEVLDVPRRSAVPAPEHTRTSPEALRFAPVRGEGAARLEAQPFGDAACESVFGVTVAPRYRQWEYHLVAPFLGRSVLEIGSGMGYFSEKLAGGNIERLILSDHDEHCLERLRRTYADRPGVSVIEVALPGRVDIGEPVESVVAMNVLEHIEDDVGALEDLAAVVRPGGRIVLWVPAYMQLYGDFDRRVGHFRRYTPATIGAAVERAGLGVRQARPVNLLGGVSWWIAVRSGGAGRPDPRLVWLYDNVVVPVSRTVEKYVRPPFGQSVLCVADVPG